MRVKLKGSDKQKLMNSKAMNMTDKEVDDYVSGLKNDKQRDKLLANMMKQIIALKHNTNRNRR